jgi:hypothetical protein
MKGQVNFGAKEIKTKIQRMEGEIDYEVEQFAADFHPDEGMTSFQSEAPSPVDKTRKGKKKQRTWLIIFWSWSLVASNV